MLAAHGSSFGRGLPEKGPKDFTNLRVRKGPSRSFWVSLGSCTEFVAKLAFCGQNPAKGERFIVDGCKLMVGPDFGH